MTYFGHPLVCVYEIGYLDPKMISSVCYLHSCVE